MLKSFLITATVLATPLWLNATDDPTTLEGKLVWASCYISDHSATPDEKCGFKECGTSCILRGKPGGLLTKDSAFYFLDAQSLPLAPYVGQQIRVTGTELSEDIFSVVKIAVKKGDAWQPLEIPFHPQK
jgi:hypothetical protein